MNLVMIKYNAGNIRGVDYALKRLGVEAYLSDDFDEIRAADKVIFPGVGNVGSAMASLQEKGLDQLIPELKQPLLGICAGMQLMCRHSEEENTPCLNIVPVPVKKFTIPELKVPHTGWNVISQYKSDLFKGIDEGEYVYFVHSYYAELSECTIATCDYGVTFSAAIHKNNFYGVQFHTELSAETGSKILSNFLNLPE